MRYHSKDNLQSLQCFGMLALIAALAIGCVIEPNPSPFGNEAPGVPSGLDGADGSGSLGETTESDGYTDWVGPSSAGQDSVDAADEPNDETDVSDGNDETDGIDGTDSTDTSSTSDAVDSGDFSDSLDLNDCVVDSENAEESEPGLPDEAACSNAACDTPPAFSELAFKISSIRLLADPTQCDANADGVISDDDGSINNATGYIRDRIDRGLNRWIIDGTLSLVLEFSSPLNPSAPFLANLHEVAPHNECTDSGVGGEESPWAFWNGTLCDYTIIPTSYVDNCPRNMIPTMPISETEIQTTTADTSWSVLSHAGAEYETEFNSLRATAETEVNSNTLTGVICGRISNESAIWHLQNFSELLDLSDGTEAIRSEIANYASTHLSCGDDGLCTFALEFSGHSFGTLTAPALSGAE